MQTLLAANFARRFFWRSGARVFVRTPCASNLCLRIFKSFARPAMARVQRFVSRESARGVGPSEAEKKSHRLGLWILLRCTLRHVFTPNWRIPGRYKTLTPAGLPQTPSQSVSAGAPAASDHGAPAAGGGPVGAAPHPSPQPSGQGVPPAGPPGPGRSRLRPCSQRRTPGPRRAGAGAARHTQTRFRAAAAASAPPPRRRAEGTAGCARHIRAEGFLGAARARTAPPSKSARTPGRC